MICPSCKNKNLTRADYKGSQLDYCPDCLGIWFDRDELRQVKDKEDKFLRWIDFDPWEDETKFRIDKSPKICPLCGVPFYEVKYDDFDARPRRVSLGLKIDLCNVCHGIWLDKGEFDKIIKYLEERITKETLSEYFDDIGEEFTEILACLAGRRVGQEKISSEIADFLIVMKLFEYRLLAKIPAISKIITGLPV